MNDTFRWENRYNGESDFIRVHSDNIREHRSERLMDERDRSTSGRVYVFFFFFGFTIFYFFACLRLSTNFRHEDLF